MIIVTKIQHNKFIERRYLQIHKRTLTIRDPSGKERVLENTSIQEMRTVIRHYTKYEPDLEVTGNNTNLLITLKQSKLWR